MFGTGPKFGISATSLPKNVVDTMTFEDNLKMVWK
jgi:hypothetical protein